MVYLENCLLIWKEDQVVVVKVAVHWEGLNNLQVSYQHKVTTHDNENFLSSVRQQVGVGASVSVVGPIVGVRGAWCSNNQKVTRFLSYSDKTISAIILDTMKGS